MTKIIEKQLNTKEVKELCRVMSDITNPDDMVKFLRDLMTLEEIDESSRRFQVAKLLTKKRIFREISKITGMSSTTIARINYWLHHGTGGYKIALEKIK